MSIPIRNLYYLFCYAWQRFPEGGAVEVGVDDCPDLPNLFARLLINSANRLLRRGLDRGYRGEVEETRSPRGKLLIDEIIKGQTLTRGAVICAFDELTPDILHNRILRSTALSLAKVPQVQRDYARELRLVAERMSGVSDLRITGDAFSRVQLSRNTSQYGAALRLCEIIYRCLLPEADQQGARFADILKDEAKMEKVFEDFLRNFYRIEQRRFSQVAAETMSWNGESLSPGGWAYLPSMVTDVTLRSPDRVIVMDAKYYNEAFTERFDARKIHSSNLYQMLTYLQHAGRSQPDATVEGILVYPTAGADERLRYRLCGYDLQIATVNLDRPWQAIHQSLLELIAEPSAASQKAA